MIQIKAAAIVALLAAVSALVWVGAADSSADGGIIGGTGHGEGIDVEYVTYDGIPRVEIALTTVPSYDVDVLLVGETESYAFVNLQPMSKFAVSNEGEGLLLNLETYHVLIQPTGSVDIFAECYMNVGMCGRISFDPNGGTGIMEDQYVLIGSALVLPGCAFKGPEGKDFDSWAVKGSTMHPGNPITVYEDTKVSAQWAESEGQDMTVILLAAAAVAITAIIVTLVVTRRR